jgi:BASS family bile acid:Na+ symporter
MILVSVCPGGNVSNFFTMLANGNVGLSVVLTSFSSFFAAFLTTLGFALWSSLSPAAEYSRSFSLSFTELALTLLLILVLPLILGILLRLKFERIAGVLRAPMKFLGIAVLAGFIGVALWNNRSAFMEHLDKVFLLVLMHNALVLLAAYLWAKIMRNQLKEATTIMIETGIQNSGLGLVIIFGFFDGNGAMAMIAAWWGVWHLIAGSVVSSIFHYRNKARKIA